GGDPGGRERSGDRSGRRTRHPVHPVPALLEHLERPGQRDPLDPAALEHQIHGGGGRVREGHAARLGEGCGTPAAARRGAAAGGRPSQTVRASGSKPSGSTGTVSTEDSTFTNSPLAADSSAESMMSSTW